jgi:hypothetical protein
VIRADGDAAAPEPTARATTNPETTGDLSMIRKAWWTAGLALATVSGLGCGGNPNATEEREAVAPTITVEPETPGETEDVYEAGSEEASIGVPPDTEKQQSQYPGGGENPPGYPEPVNQAGGGEEGREPPKGEG